VNESRFERLERNFDCKCNSELTHRNDLRKSYDSNSGKNNVSKDKTGNELLPNTNTHAITKRTSTYELDGDLYNDTQTTGPSNIDQSTNSYKNVQEDSKMAKPTTAATEAKTEMKSDATRENNQEKQAKQDNSSAYEMLKQFLGKDRSHLLSCLDEWKVIIDVSNA
jgi:hypothetical protein